MNNRFPTEGWRIAKYILISLATRVVLILIQQPLVNSIILSSDYPGRMLTILSYGQILLSTLIACLIHRYFTFRSSEKLFVALPSMLAFAFVMQFLTSIVMHITARFGMEATLTASNVLGPVEAVLTYLFQRYVLYRRSIDQGGWYIRLHPTNDEKGSTLYE